LQRLENKKITIMIKNIEVIDDYILFLSVVSFKMVISLTPTRGVIICVTGKDAPKVVDRAS